MAAPLTVPSEATVRVVTTPSSTTTMLALPLLARLAASSATLAWATPAVASALMSPRLSTPSWLVSVVMVTTGTPGPLTDSSTLALLLLDALPYWSVWVAETVAAWPSPGLAKSTVTVPLL